MTEEELAAIRDTLIVRRLYEGEARRLLAEVDRLRAECADRDAEAMNLRQIAAVNYGLYRTAEADVDVLQGSVERLTAERDSSRRMYARVVTAVASAVDAIEPDADVDGTVESIWWLRRKVESLLAEMESMAVAFDRTLAVYEGQE